MSIPKVAIVGRPNVGKSSLLNWLSRRQISVVDPTAGVTRDRVTHVMEHEGRWFELVDTGGMGVVDADELTGDIEAQIRIAIDEADLILFVVDAQSGVVPLDRHVADRLRPVEKPTLLVVNKCDSDRLDREVYEFHRLADCPLVATSVKGQRNRAGLLEAVVQHLPDETEITAAETAEPVMKLAIVGRRNVGKSTFINQLAEQDRVIVSEVPGTTRDSVDVRFEVDGKPLIAIDTPGVRKKKSLANDIEFYGLVRAQRSVRRADVVLMVFDAAQTISRVDKQLVEYVQDQHKPCIFVVNKWDQGLAAGMTSQKWADYLVKNFSTMRYVPVAFLTAKDGRNIRKTINLAQSIFKQTLIRVGTSRLNDVVQQAVDANPPPYRRNIRPKIYYATQVAVGPPTIVLKCNDNRLFDATWKRYLLGVLRDELPFDEVPIRVYYRSREHRADEAGELPEDSTSPAGESAGTR